MRWRPRFVDFNEKKALKKKEKKKEGKKKKKQVNEQKQPIKEWNLSLVTWVPRQLLEYLGETQHSLIFPVD